ncbi:ABC transporter substrate-binding protein [Paenibacillus sp. CF384]|uniref:ABC transporter substrate-binding protein n=1 Tax=Paenibacillus sp. CF384 TaxID=1884382 RepID=UPI00089D81EE|nr:ABC transporter substrate-binding protein [Paenibacillus sp. CF384]SDW97697.1 carbohydrate ABC transporter substrate-binding protein, CUT1 family [Paenibacillus sp. CF384]
MKWNAKHAAMMGILATTITVTGCSASTTNESSNAQSNTNANGNASSASGDKVKVDFWSIWDPTNGNGKLIADEIVKFNEQNPGIEIVMSGQGGYDGVAEKLEAALVAKNTPVIVQIEESFLARYNPIAADLGKYMSADTIANYNEGLTRSSYVDGVFKAAPMNRSTPILYMNADLLKAAGLDPKGPKTWTELHEYAKKLSDPAKGVYGFSGYWDTDAWYWESAVYSYGGEMVNKDGSQVVFDNEKGSGIIKLFQDMIHDKSMLNAYSAQDNQSDLIKQNFFDGKVAMDLDSVGAMGDLIKNAKFNVAVAFQPQEGGQNKVVTGGANMIVLDNATEEQKQAAGKFLDFLAQDDNVTNFFQTTGYLPTTKSALETPEMKQWLQEKPQYQVAVDQLQFAHSRPWQKNWKAMYTAILEDLKGALIDTTKDPKEVVHHAAQAAQQIIDENK